MLNSYIIFTIAIATFLCSGAAFATDRCIISIPPEKLMLLLKDGKRITGYRIKYSSGRIYCLNKIPDDWWIKIKPYMEPYQVEASAGHGASWLTINNVQNGIFDKFITIDSYGEVENIQINVDLSIDIPTEEKVSHVTFDENSMIIEVHH